MPKFLDAPSWYNSRGILSYGVGVDTNEQPMVGDVPCVHLPSGELNWRRLMVNGATSGDISIYSPTSNPTGGQVLLSSGVGAPVWQDFDVNGAAIGTGATSIYAPTSAGDGTYQVLCGGMPTPTFRSLYLHCFSYKVTGSNTIGWLTLSIIYPSSSKLTSAQITNKLSRFNDANNIYPASGGFIVPSIGTYERVTMITGIYWSGTSFSACGVRSNMYVEVAFTFSPGQLIETGSYSISHDTM